MIDQAEKLRQVIDSIKANREKEDSIKYNQALSNSSKKSTSRVLAITSGKGGVGKTNLSINLAIALSDLGYRVIVLDADFGLANVDILFGLTPKFTLLDVINNKKTIREILTDGPHNIKFISGGSGVEELANMDDRHLSGFIENIAMLDELADVIIIDTGAGLSKNVINPVMAADEVLLVTTPEPTSLTDAYALIKIVSLKDKEKKIKIILNKAENAREAEYVTRNFVTVTEKFLKHKIETLGFVLKDETVNKSVKLQSPFIISYPKCPAARNIQEIAGKLLSVNNITYKNSGIRGFIKKLACYMRN